MKKKLKYNPRIVKKCILWAILLLIVIWFGSSVISSFSKGQITSNSKVLDHSIPRGEYENYLKILSNSNAKEDPDSFEIDWGNINIPANVLYEIDVNSGELSADSENFSSNYKEPHTNKVGYYTSEQGTVTWHVNVASTGVYYLELDYVVPQGGGSNAEREIQVNNSVLFDSLSNVTFYRVWTDENEILQDINGNDLKPSQIEIFEENTMFLHDETGYITDPYMIYLKSGDNTISFKSIRENLLISGLRVVSTDHYDCKAYEDYLVEHEDAKTTSGFIQRLEAEESDRRSSPTLYATADRTSPANVPSHPVKTKYNAIGGSKWSTPGDWIGWTVEVPEAGYYNLTFRAKQNLNRGLFSTRRVYVNGVVPFQEANNARFYYDSEFKNITIGDVNGDNYLFYLNEGQNSISLEATLGDYGSPISDVQGVINDLNELYLKIIAITTANPDEYQTYNLYGENARIANNSKGWNMQRVFSESAITLNEVSKYLTKLTGEKSSLNNSLDKIVLQIGGVVDGDDVGGFASKPQNVTKDLSEFKTNLSALGTWILDIQDQSLIIEALWVHSEDAELPNANANWFSATWFSISGFVQSFWFDYQSIGVTSEEGFEKEITIWYLTSAATGREQANAVKNLIDSDFIPKTGINVILKVLAAGVLLPATLAGTGPDVAINVDGGLPVNYALRGAVYDVSQQPDFYEVTGICSAANQRDGYCTVNEDKYTKYAKFDYPDTARFQYSSMVPLELEGGYYGLPNTASFQVLFYRTDIFEQNGWSVPVTWDDVKLLVTELQVSNLEFYLPLEGAGTTIFSTMLYQRGGQFYSDDEMKSSFAEEVSYKTFEDWCSYFTDYSFALSANFTNRFRTGEMPIGIASYELFNTLTVFAPDITGKWSFAPLPGYINETGELKNSSTSGISAVIIMKNAKDVDSSWEFIKWWTQSDTQYNYARELESILGAAARHNTANVEAMKLLPWTRAERDILLEQWNKTIGIPEIAGGYYVGRNLENAIRAVINDDANPRETFSEYILQIDAEIKRKRQEFGLPVE